MIRTVPQKPPCYYDMEAHKILYFKIVVNSASEPNLSLCSYICVSNTVCTNTVQYDK